MTNWHAMSAEQAAALASGLHTLDWSWSVDDAPAVVEKFGWRTVSSRPRRITIDIGLGPDSGSIRAKNGQVTSIELQLTDFADADENAQVATAFDSFTAAITAELGEPTVRVAGPPPQNRWAGAEATLVLERSAASVWLYLVTNARLAADDRNIALDEQGLL
ncbi:DUF6301 family protein [Nocardia alba]|uniref:Uncharacterized protein n=1 Tax=Nocardia alba TaxID=225051 RepID=A0A4R1FT05_9NOCA|nr:DUF6301 family protein [Nocardia alba]TCJ94341.1 hypothetical protein DFR71_4940 [Nocardia alba]